MSDQSGAENNMPTYSLRCAALILGLLVMSSVERSQKNDAEKAATKQRTCYAVQVGAYINRRAEILTASALDAENQTSLALAGKEAVPLSLRFPRPRAYSRKLFEKCNLHCAGPVAQLVRAADS